MPQFLANTLKDQDIGIDSHAHGQHDACDTGKGQGGIDIAKHAQKDDQIQAQCDVGDETCYSIVDEHENGHSYHSPQRCPDALFNRITTQGRTCRAFLHNPDRGFEGVFQDVGEFDGLSHIIITTDLPPSLFDSPTNHRG